MSRFAVRSAVLVLLGLASNAPAEDAMKIVVHPATQGTGARREVLSSIFLKQLTRWGDGQTVIPVDQPLRSAIRAQFSQQVMKQPVIAVQAYWQKQMQAGNAPPAVKASDADVLAFVKATPGSIGYVSAGFATDDSVKVLKILD